MKDWKIATFLEIGVIILALREMKSNDMVHFLKVKFLDKKWPNGTNLYLLPKHYAYMAI